MSIKPKNMYRLNCIITRLLITGLLTIASARSARAQTDHLEITGNISGDITAYQSIRVVPPATIVSAHLYLVPNPVEASLPPDPQVAGTASIAGIDSDNDGVRDDIERYIFYAFPSNSAVRAALTQTAIDLQVAIVNSNDQNAALTQAAYLTRDMECLFYIQGEDGLDTFSELQAQMLNTKARSIAYINFSISLAGETTQVDPNSNLKSSCTFDPDAVGGGQ